MDPEVEIWGLTAVTSSREVRENLTADVGGFEGGRRREGRNRRNQVVLGSRGVLEAEITHQVVGLDVATRTVRAESGREKARPRGG
eukprot:3897901-Rhodomonas_salina.2